MWKYNSTFQKLLSEIVLNRYTIKVVENNEIKALLHLIDDPDEDVYNTVSEKIVTFGKGIIPNLEHLWDTAKSEEEIGRAHV